MISNGSTTMDDATARQVASARTLLDTERRALLEVVSRVPEADRMRHPAPGCWSIAELLEHLARVEKGVARLLVVKGSADALPAESERASAPPLTPERVARTRNRALRIEAPERVRPTGAVSAAEALAALQAMREGLLEAIDAVHPLAWHSVVHEHAVLGPLDLAGWLEFIPHHEARHVAQAEEIAGMLERGRSGEA